jgi:hypothetical protein
MLQRRLPALAQEDDTSMLATKKRRADVQADPQWRPVYLPTLDDRLALGARGGKPCTSC